MNAKRGFTLYELIIVMGILASLAVVTTAAVYQSKLKGNDTAIKADLTSVQVQAENFYSSTWNGSGSLKNSYGAASVTGGCIIGANPAPANNSLFKDATVQASLKAATNLSGVSNVYCYSLTADPYHDPPIIAGYVVAAKLSNGTYWCVDSTGFNGLYSGNPAVDLQNSNSCTPN